MNQRYNNKLMNLKTRSRTVKYLLGGLAGTALIYVFSCLPNTLRVYDKLIPLREEFEAVAGKGPDHAFTYNEGDEYGVRLDFGGRLDEIVSKRNEILDKNHSVLLGSWKAVDYNLADMSRLVFCYDPLLDVKTIE